MQRILSLFLVLSATLAFGGCLLPVPVPGKYKVAEGGSGRVVDEKTKQPIAAATVCYLQYVDGQGFRELLPKVETDMDGYFLLPPIKKEAEETRKALIEAATADIFAIVVRQFTDPNVFHPGNSIDPVRDYTSIRDELVFADLYLVETRLERIEKQQKGKKEEMLTREKDVLVKLKDALEKGSFMSSVKLEEHEQRIIKGLNFLTMKPVFAVVNCDEDKLKETYSFPDGTHSVNISIKIENEIQQLSEAERKDFLAALGLTEQPRSRLIKLAYNFADLISFYTAGPKEAHSWTIKRGTTSLKAAGTIHSDLEKGFIRAEVIHFEDLKTAGSEAKARSLGLYKLHGKEYAVQDGDIIEIRFNI